jgi:hypothetical protein
MKQEFNPKVFQEAYDNQVNQHLVAQGKPILPHTEFNLTPKQVTVMDAMCEHLAPWYKGEETYSDLDVKCLANEIGLPFFVVAGVVGSLINKGWIQTDEAPEQHVEEGYMSPLILYFTSKSAIYRAEWHKKEGK